MSNLLKIMIFTAPVLALIFYYVSTQQQRLDVQIQKHDAVFERDWNEFNAEFDNSEEGKKKYIKRVEKYEKKIAELEKREKLTELKSTEFSNEFDKSLEELEKELEAELNEYKK